VIERPAERGPYTHRDVLLREAEIFHFTESGWRATMRVEIQPLRGTR